MTTSKGIREDAFRRLLDDNGEYINFDPKTEGGFIWKDGLPTGYIRSPFWRARENDTKLHGSDIRPVFTEPKPSASLQGVETGGEFEMYVWDPGNQTEAPVMAPNSSVPNTLEEANNGAHFEAEDPIFEELDPDKKQIGYSAELATSCIEMNFHHTPHTFQAALSMARSLKTLAKAAEKEGWRLTPISAFPHRPLEPKDTSQDPYVKRIAMEFMGWENVRHFIGSSFQVHVEMLDLESGLKAMNMYQQIAPLLYALSLAGPFAHGSTQPNLHDMYIQDESSPRRVSDTESYDMLNNDDWMSIRYPARWRGSPSGGSYVKPLPENAGEFFTLAEAGLKNNDPHSPENIPSPARAGGHHTDRIRVDIGPNGTLEISNMDTFGGNVLKLAAIQEFTRVLMWKLQLYAKAGKMEQLSHEYPQLFPPQITENILRLAHINSIEVAKRGVDAVLQTADDQQATAGELFNQLLLFVNEPIHDFGQEVEYQGLPQGIMHELMKSAQVPNQQSFQNYREPDGVVSIDGFYKSGIGTLSHWLKQRARDLIEKRGMSEEDAIKDCMDNLGSAYHTFLAGLNGNIKALFA